jgi:ribokinase
MSRIAIVGSVNLDLVATCRRLPHPGETLGGATFGRHPGGKGANQALAARRLGATVSLTARVGKDTDADEALALLETEGVDLTRVGRDSVHPTGVAVIVVAEGGENQIVIAPGANDHLVASDVDVAGYDAVVCQLEIPDEPIEEAAGQAGGLFCVNAAPARRLPAAVFRRADVIIVNEVEHAQLESDLARYEGLVAITAGPAGAAIYRRGRQVAKAEPPPVKVVDTLGAGDAFVAALVVSMLAGKSAVDSLTYACAAGALATTVPGAQPSLPTAARVDAAV